MSIHVSDTNLNTIFQNIQKHSPHPSKVKIIAVTKGFNYQAIISAISKNILCIGENKVQEFFNKQTKLQTHKFESHLIGHLQSNKTKKATDLFNVIQTVDSIKLADKINNQNLSTAQRIYVQINIETIQTSLAFNQLTFIKKLKKLNLWKT